MSDERFGRVDPTGTQSVPDSLESGSSGPQITGGTWPECYSSPRLDTFGTLTQLTLSGTATGNFETNVLTRKYRPKPTS
jgi:hypothetical protein